MRRFALTAVALAAIAVAGCSSSTSSPASSPTSSSAPATSSSPAAQTGSITVFAASSLKGTFTEIGKQFETAHPGDTVKFNFGASSALAEQINSLAKSSVKTALCQPQVPCGVVATEVFKNAKITVKPVTLQPDVKSVLTQVELGNVDAGVVYVTDVMAAGSKVKGVTIPADVNASTLYPIAALTHSKESSIAQAFVAYVLSPAGEQVLKAAGFEQP